MNRNLSLGEIEEFLTEHFRRDWTFWSEVTHMIRHLEDRKLYRKSAVKLRPSGRGYKACLVLW